MKKILFLFPAILSMTLLVAQNVGIGTTEPFNKLQIEGNLLVNSPTFSTSTAPTAAQQKTLVNNGTIFIFAADSIGRIFDTGGPAANYAGNQTGNASIGSAPASVGMEITIESIQLGTGDSLIISETFGSQNVFLAVGNGYSTTGKFIFNNSDLYIRFKSNGDASTGTGFSLLFRRLYDNTNTLSPISGFTGNALFFDTKNGSLVSGFVNNNPRGTHSTSIGYKSAAGGNGSIAMGVETKATGSESVAMGYHGEARGLRSTALGATTIAAGDMATAMGLNTVARGFASTVIGLYNNPILNFGQSMVIDETPLFIIGNGNATNALSNALVVRKDGWVGIGTDLPQATVHIRDGSGGGLLLENANDNNKWRLYSASGDNNLTFYNNSDVEIADIDDVTGTFSALSDSRYKKDIQNMSPVLSLVMQLKPQQYHFNWQQKDEQLQVGFLAQEAHSLFPQLVSYDREKDLYKMNYAGFSTVAIKAIQEQQAIITDLQQQMKTLNKQNGELQERLAKLEAALPGNN